MIRIFSQVIFYFILSYRVSQEECAILRESVPYVKLCRYNPKHLYPKLNGYGDNGHRKVWAFGVSTYCTPSVTSYSSNAHARQRQLVMQWPWQTFYSTVALTSQDNAVCVKYLEAQGQIRETCDCFIVQFNGFMSLTSYFDVKYRY